MGRRQLLQVERRCSDMKTTVELSPMDHRKRDGTRAHMAL